MRSLIIALALLCVAAAPSPNFQNVTAAGSINVTGAAGYQQNGATILNVGTNSSETIILVGPFAGASLSLNAQFVSAIGSYAFESLTTTQAENAAVGNSAGIAATTAGGMAILGNSACSGQTTAAMLCVGNDAGRDVQDIGGSIAIGAGAYSDGADTGEELIIGTNTWGGNAGTITMGGTITTGDVLSFTVASSNSCNGTSITVNCTTGAPVTVNYAVVSGDTSLTVLTGHVATAITNGTTSVNYILGDGQTEGAHNLFTPKFIQSDPTNHPTLIQGHYPTSWLLAVTYSCTGTCGETAAIGAASAGGFNTVVGSSSFSFVGRTTANDNTSTGYGNANKFVTTAQQNTFDGMNIAVQCSTCSQNDISGYLAGNGLTTGSQNVIHGSYAEQAMTTGSKNTVDGDHTTAGGGCITTGSNNDEYGQGACVLSPTASNQLSIKNAIYGNNNSGGGSTVSTGCIGFYTTGCSGSDVAFGVPMILAAYTVATLPSGVVGMRVYVTDATACAFGSTPSGSGSVKCPLFYNGSAWVGG